MTVLALNDPNVRSVLNTEPLLQGMTILGRGAFCCVFEGKKKTRVLKLTADATHVAYLCDRCAPKSNFKPKVFRNYGIVGETSPGESLHLLEVERLEPIPKKSTNWKVVNALMACDAFGKTSLRRQLRDVIPVYPAIVDFLLELRRFSRVFGCNLDFHRGNFMQRKSGQLVFSDPVLDEQSLYEKDYLAWTSERRLKRAWLSDRRRRQGQPLFVCP